MDEVCKSKEDKPKKKKNYTEVVKNIEPLCYAWDPKLKNESFSSPSKIRSKVSFTFPFSHRFWYFSFYSFHMGSFRLWSLKILFFFLIMFFCLLCYSTRLSSSPSRIGSQVSFIFCFNIVFDIFLWLFQFGLV